LEFQQDTWNRYLILGCVSAHVARNAISNVEQKWSYKASRNDLVLLSTTTLSNNCQRKYPQLGDAIGKQLQVGNNVSLALDSWIAMNTLAITLVIASYTDWNWALGEVQLPVNEIDGQFFSAFESQLRMIGQGPTYWSKASSTFGRHT
jgi:hypothetical protein